MTFFDATDLLLYLRNHTTLSGIQRVQCEIMRNLPDCDAAGGICFVALDAAGNPRAIETSALLDLITYMSSSPVTRSVLDRRVGQIFEDARPLSIRRGDRFLSIGAFWNIRGGGIFLQKLKNSGVTIGLYIHDIFNITAPEYFVISATNVFIKGFVAAIAYADFILTSSQYNTASLNKYFESRRIRALPIEVVPLGHELSISKTTAEISTAVADIANSDFVLGVGTIEVRKNPTYGFNIWKMMLRAGRQNIPKLVLAGRSGWLVRDFIEQLKACNNLGGKIVLLHDATDVELALLYRKCILTMFPSFGEGWGLPVGESLAHGKICIASNAGALPEVAGDLADYVDPYNVYDGLRILTQYLDDPDLRRKREAEIAQRFKSRTWREVAKDLLNSAEAQAAQIPPFEGVAAINLPPNRYLPITSDGGAMLANAMEGDLSADLICISGWRPPDADGIRASQPTTTIRFRADAPAGTPINMVMRLRATNGSQPRVRIHAGSGAQTEVALNEAADSLAVLPCEVEADSLVSATLSLAGTQRGSGHAGAPYWSLRGILYVRPERPAGEVSSGLQADRTPSGTGQPTVWSSLAATSPSKCAKIPNRVKATAAPKDDDRRALSFDAFLGSTDSYWPSSFTSHRDAPIFADHRDKQIFYNVNSEAVGAKTDRIRLVRRSNQYVSTLRFAEGTIFDSSGVSRGLGYLEVCPPDAWLSRSAEGTWINADAIAAAPHYDGSYLIFYNGNLHNYYHWMVESLLPLSALSQAMGPDSNLHIALPRSRRINAVFDHRDSLRAVGLDGYPVEDVATNLIRVREAIWIESDVVQSMPAPFLQEFQRKVAALHARSRQRKKRRLLVARKGPTRMIHNIAQVSSVLSKHGFDTVYLEGMSVTDQIVLFQNAEFIVSPHGAGLANLLFCEPGTKIIEFMPSVEVRPFFWLISEKLGLVHGMLFCAAAKGEGFQASIDVDVDKLEALYRMVDAHH